LDQLTTHRLHVDVVDREGRAADDGLVALIEVCHAGLHDEAVGAVALENLLWFDGEM
jgi:hypothetical protein